MRERLLAELGAQPWGDAKISCWWPGCRRPCMGANGGHYYYIDIYPVRWWPNETVTNSKIIGWWSFILNSNVQQDFIFAVVQQPSTVQRATEVQRRSVTSGSICRSWAQLSVTRDRICIYVSAHSVCLVYTWVAIHSGAVFEGPAFSFRSDRFDRVVRPVCVVFILWTKHDWPIWPLRLEL